MTELDRCIAMRRIGDAGLVSCEDEVRAEFVCYKCGAPLLSQRQLRPHRARWRPKWR